MEAEVRIGIDIGGTFTDFVVYHPSSGELESFKLLSTPANPGLAVLQGLDRIAARLPAGIHRRIVHGSTVATNALLERKGAVTALVTTRGFRDVLQIGRQNRPSLYDFFAGPPQPLVPAERRLEVDERVAANGQVLAPLDPGQVSRLAGLIEAQSASSVAVCLLFSFLHPDHELQIGAALRQAGFDVSLSSEILPEYREYERLSTTVVNAYVSPVLDHYLGFLEEALSQGEQGSTHLRVMQSNGGQISLAEARRSGVRCILSGPAGGLTGAQHTARNLLQHSTSEITSDPSPKISPLRLITFDMGGTSTDVSLIDGEPRLTSESEVGGCPIRIPVLDIHTIGAGGGSIASVDLGGALRVGPQSAGADPGPACYGRGHLPTVTDANLVLGRLSPQHFLDGQMPLDSQRAFAALAKLGEALEMDPVQAALGVIEVVNAHMERALRLISVERGVDPGAASGAPFTLLSFGGAGGLHAASLARRLDLPYVLVPPLASTLSAYGMLAANVVKDYTQTVMLAGDTPSGTIEAALQPLLRRGREDLLAEGVAEDDLVMECSLDMRYQGQSYEIGVPFQPGSSLADDFHAAHRAVYGYDRPETPLQIVNLHLRAIGKSLPPSSSSSTLTGPDPQQAYLEHRPLVLPGGHRVEAPFYRFEHLLPGNRLPGPAIAVRADTTVFIEPQDQAFVDGFGNLILTVAGPPRNA